MSKANLSSERVVPALRSAENDKFFTLTDISLAL